MVRSYRPNRKSGSLHNKIDATKNLLVAIYARISTGEDMQADGHSIPAQLRACRDMCARRGWTVVGEYVDEDYSGSNDKRPAFQQMIADAYNGKVQMILFHKLDRFSRSISDILFYFRDLESRNIMICSYSEVFDFSDPADRAKFHMLAVFAQWYIDNLSAETTKGKRERALSGCYNGRLPFGYVRGEKNGDADIVPEEGAVILQAFEAYSTGNYTDAQIAELINESNLPTRDNRRWSKDSVRDFLQNEFYYGMVKYRDELINGKHKPVITKELFDKVQEVRITHRLAARTNAATFKTYPLGGLLRCTTCGQTLRAYSTKSYRYYRDATDSRGLSCEYSGKLVRAEVLEKEIGALVCRIRLPEDWQKEIRETVLQETERARIQERRRFLEEKLRRLGSVYTDGLITSAQYTRERDSYRAELATLIIPEDVSLIDAGLYLETLHDLWSMATLEEKRDICRLLLKEVHYDWDEERIKKLVPNAAFTPLFRRIAEFQEQEETPGHFWVTQSKVGAVTC